jgi:hypothetical protein
MTHWVQSDRNGFPHLFITDIVPLCPNTFKPLAPESLQHATVKVGDGGIIDSIEPVKTPAPKTKREAAPVACDDAEAIEEPARRTHRSRGPPGLAPADKRRAPLLTRRPSKSVMPKHGKTTTASSTKRRKGTQADKTSHAPKLTVTLGREIVGFITTARPFAAFSEDGRPITGLFPTRCAAVAAILDARRDDGRVA